MDIDNQYGTLKIQKKLMGLLKNFHQFCVENGVKYSLDWGTLLGAIRHKGFIPWDDDLDIMVDRANYNKLLKCIGEDNRFMYDETNLWIGRVRMANDDSTDIYPPTIDVLIMDNAPDGKLRRKLRLLLVKLLQGTLKKNPKNISKFKKVGVIMRIIAMLTYYAGKPFSYATKIYCYNKLAQLSNKKNTKEITSYYEEYSCLGKYYSKNLMQEIILVPFEDMEAYVVKDYHNCLVTQFGENYLTPIKTRLNHSEQALVIQKMREKL